jgi:hypothetical protein
MVQVIRRKQHNGTFCDRYGTAFYDLKTEEEKVQRAIRQGLEGLCLEAVARVEDVHPTTVQQWIERACLQAKAADQKVITGLVTENIELDELYSFAGAKRPDEQEDDRSQVGQHRTHCAMARESRLLLEVVIGPRTQESATELVEGAGAQARPWLLAIVVERRMGAIPVRADTRLRCPDPLHQGQRAGPPEGATGRARSAPALRASYQTACEGGLVAVTRRMIFGVEELIPLKQISTSLLERLNGTTRQHVAPLRRKTRSFAKCRTTLNTQTQLFKSYYNLCRKHGSLRGKTPAQAAGLTDHQWTLGEMLTFNAAITSKIT